MLSLLVLVCADLFLHVFAPAVLCEVDTAVASISKGPEIQWAIEQFKRDFEEFKVISRKWMDNFEQMVSLDEKIDNKGKRGSRENTSRIGRLKAILKSPFPVQSKSPLIWKEWRDEKSRELSAETETMLRELEEKTSGIFGQLDTSLRADRQTMDKINDEANVLVEQEIEKMKTEEAKEHFGLYEERHFHRNEKTRLFKVKLQKLFLKKIQGHFSDGWQKITVLQLFKSKFLKDKSGGQQEKTLHFEAKERKQLIAQRVKQLLVQQGADLLPQFVASTHGEALISSSEKDAAGDDGILKQILNNWKCAEWASKSKGYNNLVFGKQKRFLQVCEQFEMASRKFFLYMGIVVHYRGNLPIAEDFNVISNNQFQPSAAHELLAKVPIRPDFSFDPLQQQIGLLSVGELVGNFADAYMKIAIKNSLPKRLKQKVPNSEVMNCLSGWAEMFAKMDNTLTTGKVVFVYADQKYIRTGQDFKEPEEILLGMIGSNRPISVREMFLRQWNALLFRPDVLVGTAILKPDECRGPVEEIGQSVYEQHVREAKQSLAGSSALRTLKYLKKVAKESRSMINQQQQEEEISAAAATFRKEYLEWLSSQILAIDMLVNPLDSLLDKYTWEALEARIAEIEAATKSITEDSRARALIAAIEKKPSNQGSSAGRRQSAGAGSSEIESARLIQDDSNQSFTFDVQLKV